MLQASPALERLFMSNFDTFIEPRLNKEMKKEIDKLSEKSKSFYKEMSVTLLRELNDRATIKHIHLIVMRAIATGLNAKTGEFNYTSAADNCSELSEALILKLEKESELEAEKGLEQAELEAEKVAELEAEKVAELEAEKEVDQAELEAEKEAALEAEKEVKLAELEAEEEAEMDLVAQKEAQAEAWDQMNREIYEILSTELPEGEATDKATELAEEAISEGELTPAAIADTLAKAQRIVDEISDKKREVWSSK